MAESIVSLITATALLLGSPGPAPLALAGAGSVYGVRRSIPFLIGILAGLCVAIIGTTMGLAALLITVPQARLIVQVLGVSYIGYVAFKIATAPVLPGDSGQAVQAPTLADGFILNLLNPKAYAAFLAIFSQFLLPFTQLFWSFLATAVVCMLVATIVDYLWLCFGGFIGPLFNKPRPARILRITFAVLMMAAVLSVFIV